MRKVEVLILTPFLEPLSAEEETLYLKRYAAGDKEAGDILIERNLRLVAHIVKKYVGADREQDDLISIGTIGLIKAVQTFRPEKGNKLVTYAAKCIENELLMMLRAEKKKAKDVSLYDPIGTDKEGNAISLLDVIEYLDPDVVEKEALKDNVRKMYLALNEVLSDTEKEIVCLRYGLGGGKEFTQREIAERMGISRSYVSRIEKRALQKLRAKIGTN